jgi:hypothetical protein
MFLCCNNVTFGFHNTRGNTWLPERLSVSQETGPLCPMESVRYSCFIVYLCTPTVVRSPAEAKDFSSRLCVQTGSEAHPVSCTMGTGDLFPVVKRDWGPFSAEVKNEYELYFLSPLAPAWRSRTALLLYFISVHLTFVTSFSFLSSLPFSFLCSFQRYSDFAASLSVISCSKARHV